MRQQVKEPTQDQQVQAASQDATEHPEQSMLAWALGHLEDHGLLGVDTEAHKMVLLAGLNLVECIADTAPAGAESKGGKVSKRSSRQARR